MPQAAEYHDAVVIGAGPGGLACAAMLGRAGTRTVVLERDAIAASWRGHYDRLHLHTWRLLSGLPGLRISSRRGRWVARDGLVSYLEAYAAHHRLDVRTGVEALRVEREAGGGGWLVETSAGAHEAPSVVVATGYNRAPLVPAWPGREQFSGDGDLTRFGLPAPAGGMFSDFRERDVVPILDVGLVRLIRTRTVEPVAAVESFAGARVRLADGTELTPDAVIAATGYRRGLEPLVGHLGVLDERSGRPLRIGGEQHPAAPGLHFVGYRNPLSGMLWEISWEARRIARAAQAPTAPLRSPEVA